MAYFGVKDQIFRIMNIEVQTTAIFKWERWQRFLIFVLYAICSLIVISGDFCFEKIPLIFDIEN